VLELAILGLLKERPMHGYEIRKSLREDFGVLSNLSFGSLYPALARLESAGAVIAAESTGVTRRPRRGDETLPLTGSIGGEKAAIGARRSLADAAAALSARSTRARKVYEITARGEAIFEELLESAEPGGEDPRGFSLRLAFARHLSPQARIRLLERRRAQLADRLQRSERSLARRSTTLDPYERSLAEHANETVGADLSWIDRLLDRERAILASLGPTSPVDHETHHASDSESSLPARAGTAQSQGAIQPL
jgi:DNA-binding PadR family transcriptional regulator